MKIGLRISDDTRHLLGLFALLVGCAVVISAAWNGRLVLAITGIVVLAVQLAAVFVQRPTLREWLAKVRGKRPPLVIPRPRKR